MRVGFQNSATSPDLGFSRLVFADEAAEDGSALDSLLGRGQREVVWPRRVELAAAMGRTSVVVALVLRQDQLQMPLAEDKHPVGDLGPGGEHEPFRISVRARAAGRDLHGLNPGVGQHCVERLGELSGPIANQEPEGRCTITQVHQEIADLLHGPRPVRVGGTASSCRSTSSSASLEANDRPSRTSQPQSRTKTR